MREPLVCLAVGVILTVVVAWAFWLWHPAPRVYSQRISYPDRIVLGDRNAPALAKTSIGFRERAWVFDTQGCFLHLRLVEGASGWPRLGLAIYQGEGEHPTLVGPPMPAGWSKSARWRHFPVIPLWLGFAIDVAFWGAVSWLLLFAPFAVRRGLRRRGDRCVRCGYELAGLDVCPECGADS